MHRSLHPCIDHSVHRHTNSSPQHIVSPTRAHAHTHTNKQSQHNDRQSPSRRCIRCESVVRRRRRCGEEGLEIESERRRSSAVSQCNVQRSLTGRRVAADNERTNERTIFLRCSLFVVRRRRRRTQRRADSFDSTDEPTDGRTDGRLGRGGSARRRAGM